MLYTIEKQKVEYIPHFKDYQKWRKNLTDKQYIEIMEEMEKQLNKQEIQVSSFIPGSDWNYPYFYIYEACDEQYQNAAFFFGLLFWEAIMRHSENWAFIKNNRQDIKGTTYFKIQI